MQPALASEQSVVHIRYTSFCPETACPTAWVAERCGGIGIKLRLSPGGVLLQGDFPRRALLLQPADRI